MFSTTIRHSTLPENSQSIDFASARPPHSYPHADSAAHDPSAPESHPRSPRYEPPHLRHRPGDTWEIGGRPHDPADPGPYGSPGWHQDRRTGRHRRDELPDPLPPEAETEKPAWPNPVPRIPIQPDRPRPRRHRHEPESEPAPEPEEPHRFTRLREEAWERWLVDSECLATAHTQRRPAFGERMVNAAQRLTRWIGGRLTGASTPGATAAPAASEPAQASGHRAVRLPVSLPRNDNGRINAWELQFDVHRPAAGGGLA